MPFQASPASLRPSFGLVLDGIGGGDSEDATLPTTRRGAMREGMPNDDGVSEMCEGVSNDGVCEMGEGVSNDDVCEMGEGAVNHGVGVMSCVVMVTG
jgi:hypothetical protein